ncbi:bifunctional mannosyl-3-phosphoglycerate synthase/mannosyl-3 phosphoglycerate phosphatase [Chloroflexota bacterium]
MRIENTNVAEYLGSVKIHGLRRVLELDSGAFTVSTALEKSEAQRVTTEAIRSVEQKMAIILPIKDEDLKVFEGVLSGIPHDCLMIVISNSKRGETDTFKSEKDVLTRFCLNTERKALIIHQKDPAMADALKEAGYTEILDRHKLIRNGKSEGMILGIFLAMLTGKEYIGFIDTDNYIPGAVWEYVKHYATGFNVINSPYAMVRILWRYKPKVSGELYFRRWGRVSEITNYHVNHFIASRSNFETEIIKTANAGEHAMSLELAKRLTYASGYGVETQELISVFEQFGGILPIVDKEAAEHWIEILQTETINPHLHKDKGEEHLLKEMLLPSLSVIYHSPLCENSTKQLIVNQLIEQKCISKGKDVPRVRLIPPPQKANVERLASIFEEHLPFYFVPSGAVIAEKAHTFEPVVEVEGEAKKVVFTDLDGTLLHPVNYSYSPALDMIRSLQGKNIPIVFCSAKTSGEQISYREELGINDPFIVENGGAIFIPRDYFRFPFSCDRKVDDYLVIELGMSYTEVRMRLDRARKKSDLEMVGFGDMSNEEVALKADLSLRAAELAKQREYSETIILEGDQRKINQALEAIKNTGLDYIFGGRFYEVMGSNDKGRAVKILSELYKLNFGEVMTIGIGDSENDTPMLKVVDKPRLVQTPKNRWIKITVPNLKRVRGIGPKGWSRAIKDLIPQ